MASKNTLPWEKNWAAGKRRIRATRRYLLEHAAMLASLLAEVRTPVRKNWEVACGAIVWTAIRRMRLIAKHVEEGCLSEAAILARTLIDVTISCAYLLEVEGLRREHLASRFMSFERVQLGTLVERWLRRYPQASQELTRDVADFLHSISKSKRRTTSVFTDIEDKAVIGWSGKSQAEMIRALDSRPLRRMLDGLRTEPGFLLSAFVHPTPMGIGAAGRWGDLVCDEIEETALTCAAVLIVRALPELGVNVRAVTGEGGPLASAGARLAKKRERESQASAREPAALPPFDFLKRATDI